MGTPIITKAKLAESTLLKLRNAEKAKLLSRFFKTGPGEYGEGDRFLGVTVPQMRKISRLCLTLPLSELEILMQSEWHEVRALGAVLYTEQFKRSKDLNYQDALWKSYQKQWKQFNNWDLVDLSAPTLVSGSLRSLADRTWLATWARSPELWKRRIAMVGTHGWIRKGEFKDALRVAHLLVNDSHDLIHKAVGWMLREVGKRDLVPLREFLKIHAATMPRTMLRYAIEHLPAAEKKRWMNQRLKAMNAN